MSGTVAAAVRAALVGTSGVLEGLAGLSGVKVAYSMPRDIPRELVCGGTVTGSVSLAAMRGSARIKREENLSLAIHIRVHQPGEATTEFSDARAVEISTPIEEYIAGNSTLGGVTDLKLAAVEGIDLDGFIDDDGATSLLTLRIGLKAFLL